MKDEQLLLILTECFLCARNYFKDFFCINLYKPHNNSNILALTDGKTMALRPCVLLKVIQLGKGRSGIPTHGYLIAKSVLNNYAINRIQLEIILLFTKLYGSNEENIKKCKSLSSSRSLKLVERHLNIV